MEEGEGFIFEDSYVVHLRFETWYLTNKYSLEFPFGDFDDVLSLISDESTYILLGCLIFVGAIQSK